MIRVMSQTPGIIINGVHQSQLNSSVIMRSSSSLSDLLLSQDQPQLSLISSKLTLKQSHESSLRSRKGYSFGSSPRNSMLQVNLLSPSPKYHIQGLAEISLNHKKGPSMGSSRSSSLERTPLSYHNFNYNPGPADYKLDASKKVPSAVFGKQKNEKLLVAFLNQKSISPNPGPGTYKSKVVKLKGGKITSESKRFFDGKENVPGPGRYEISDPDIVSKGSKVSRVTISLRPSN